MKCILIFVSFMMTTSILMAETIGTRFDDQFQIKLPDGYAITYAGGKEGEKQFSLTNNKDSVLSIFVYYDGLNLEKWPSYFDKNKDYFFYKQNEIYVYAVLPDKLSEAKRNEVRSILKSIKLKNSNQRVDLTR